MVVDKGYLDLVMVPLGLLFMFGYHLFLLYRVIKLPHTTVIGYENHNKKYWVERMMQGIPTDTGLALQVITSNMSASTYMASLSITLSSLIGTWVGSPATPFSPKVFMNDVIYGDTSATTVAIKYVTLLFCFLVASTSFIQSARYFIHVNFLISTPDSGIPVNYVQSALIRGSNFWSLGLRACYFATTLLLWIFGPIPMFIGSISMVTILHFLDTNSTPLHQYRPFKKPMDGDREGGTRPPKTLLPRNFELLLS